MNRMFLIKEPKMNRKPLHLFQLTLILAITLTMLWPAGGLLPRAAA